MAVSPCDNCSTSADSSVAQANKTAYFKIIADAISDMPNQGIKKTILLYVLCNVGVHNFYQDVRPACGYVVHQTRSYDLKLHQTKAMEKEEALVKIIGLI